MSRRTVLKGAGFRGLRDRQRRGASPLRHPVRGPGPGGVLREGRLRLDQEAGRLELARLHRRRREGREEHAPGLRGADRHRVSYTDDVSDNAEFFAKVRNQLGDCQPIGRDMMVLTDWMAAKMIGLGWIQPLDADKVAQPAQEPDQAPAGPASGTRTAPTPHPWQSGLTGIAYNAKLTKEVGSFEDLLTRPDLKGKITLLSEMRDTMALHAQDRRREPGRLHRARVGAGRSPSSPASSRPARCGRSPATSTSRTSPPATSSPARRGPAT